MLSIILLALLVFVYVEHRRNRETCLLEALCAIFRSQREGLHYHFLIRRIALWQIC